MKLNTKYYFQHDYNSRSDGKMIEIRMKHGMCGVGTYWSMVEMLHENEGYIDLKPNRLAYELGTDEQMINDIVELCFSIVDGKITCDRVIENLNHRIEIKEKKSNAGKTGMANRWNKNNPNGVITEVLQSYNTVITEPTKSITPVIENDNTVITEHNIGIDIGIDKGIDKGIEIVIDKDKDKGIEIVIDKLKRIFKQDILDGIIKENELVDMKIKTLTPIIDQCIPEYSNWRSDLQNKGINYVEGKINNKYPTIEKTLINMIKAVEIL